MKRNLQVFRLMVFLLTLPLAGSVVARDLSLSEAVRRGLETSPDLRMGRADLRKAEAEKAASVAGMAPRLSIESKVFYWDSATDMTFDLPPDLIAFIQTVLPSDQTLSTSMDFQVMERLTGEVVLQAVQPLSPLYSLANAYLARKAAHLAALYNQEADRNTARHNVTEAFFRLRSVTSMVGVARLGVEQVKAHIKTARAFHKAGIVGRDDVLRAETALARVQEQLSRAENGETLARVALNMAVGLPPGEDTNPVGQFQEDPPPWGSTLQESIDKALANRPEIAAVGQQVEAADAGRKAMIGALVPTLSAVFRYNYQKGNLFQQEQNYFVGGVLTWNFWQWGEQWYRMKATQALRDKALAGMEKARLGITLDVTKAWTDIRTARASIAMNRKAIESAQENLRVVTKKYEASAATSVEVLDAQSDLNQSRSAYQVGLFTYHTARSNLERAIGEGVDR
ncbi:MAG: TolC family protein [Deltaproteobacteria bacterium]|nr:TolC family protein [Deltaproteobacteria bacterium]